MNASEEPVGESAAKVQALFYQGTQDLIMLDLIALEPFEWGTKAIAQGAPLTVTVNVPEDVSGDISRIVEPWAENCEILRLQVRPEEAGETVLLFGQHDKLFLEFYYPLPGGQ